MLRLQILSFLFVCCLPLVAQPGKLTADDEAFLHQQVQQLNGLAYTMHTDSSEDRRFLACRELITTLVTTLKTEDSYRFPFDSLQGITVRESPDEQFRIFSWELCVDAGTYRHYGAIQYNSSALQLTPLLDRGSKIIQMANPEVAITGADNWLGYVVYDIIPAGRYQGKPIYFLFGFDRYGRWHRQKILDVLSFDDQGQPVFGAPVFHSFTMDGQFMPDRSRLILRYGAEVNAVLRYDGYNQRVIFENLVMIEGPNGEGPIMVPDGSYHALEFNAPGLWKETDKVFDHKFDEPPGVKTKKATKDLFGREVEKQ